MASRGTPPRCAPARFVVGLAERAAADVPARRRRWAKPRTARRGMPSRRRHSRMASRWRSAVATGRTTSRRDAPRRVSPPRKQPSSKNSARRPSCKRAHLPAAGGGGIMCDCVCTWVHEHHEHHSECHATTSRRRGGWSRWACCAGQRCRHGVGVDKLGRLLHNFQQLKVWIRARPSAWRLRKAAGSASRPIRARAHSRPHARLCLETGGHSSMRTVSPTTATARSS